MRLVSSLLARVRPSDWGCLGGIVVVSGVIAAILIPGAIQARNAARASVVT